MDSRGPHGGNLMKLRSPWLIRLVALLASALIRWWMGTIRYRLAVSDPCEHPHYDGKQRYIYAFWHETILVPIGLKPKGYVLISQHADGELIAQICRFLGIGVVRGSTTRGESRGLLELVRCSQTS